MLAVETAVNLAATTLFEELEAAAAAQEDVRVIVLDTLADLYPANENDRAKVRQFVGILRGLAIRQKCAVLLLAHPSLTGLMSGSGTSGSTAWNNSVRSRLYMERVISKEHEPDPDRRVLKTMKSNYGRVGDEVSLTWRRGVFVADEVPTGLERLAAGAKAERVFLKLLRAFTAQGRYVSPNVSNSHAPALFAAHPDREGVSKAAFKMTMETLLASGRVIIAEHGRGATKKQHLQLPEGADE